MFLPYLADFLVVFGVFVMTLGVYGVMRMPDAYTRLHAASKMVFLGLMPLLLASVLVGGLEVAPRAVLIAAFLILTTPVSSHVIGRAAYLRDEKMRTHEAYDESGGDLGIAPGEER